MKISFMSSKDIGKKCLMGYKNDNKKNMIGVEANVLFKNFLIHFSKVS